MGGGGGGRRGGGGTPFAFDGYASPKILIKNNKHKKNRQAPNKIMGSGALPVGAPPEHGPSTVWSFPPLQTTIWRVVRALGARDGVFAPPRWFA